MAKKTESKQNEQASTTATPENEAISENVSEMAGSVLQEAAGTTESTKRMDEILNNDAELRRSFTEPVDEAAEKEQTEPQEKILFYVKTVNEKTAIRSEPEYPMAGASNIVGIITDRGPYGIADVANGFGRIAGGTGWIMLDSSVVIRQG